jgi:hypothetical protein
MSDYFYSLEMLINFFEPVYSEGDWTPFLDIAEENNQ